MAEPDVERECRICRGEDEPNRPLLFPCRCSGSIKYTHEDCLVNWLAQSGSSRCELCNHPFRFEPLYQPDTPSALPTKEFLVGVLALTRKTFRTVARIVLVFTVWLFCLPLGTCWTWYALFINSPSQLPALLASRGLSGIVTDAFYGFLLSAGIVFIYLGVSSLREYVRHFPNDVVVENDDPMFGEPDDDAIPEGVDDYESDDTVDAAINFQEHHHAQMQQDADVHHNIDYERAVPPLPEQDDPNAPHMEYDVPINDNEDRDALDDEVMYQFEELLRDTYEVIAGGDSDEEANENEAAIEPNADEGQQIFEPEDPERNQGNMIEFEAPDSENGSVNDDDEGPDFHPNAEPPADAIQVHNQGNHVQPQRDDEDDQEARGEGGAIFGLFELDPDEVPLEEVVGLKGHIRNLFDNACTVLLSNAIFLGVFTLIPLLIGRLTLRLFSLNSFPMQLLSAGEASLFAKVKPFIISLSMEYALTSFNSSWVTIPPRNTSVRDHQATAEQPLSPVSSVGLSFQAENAMNLRPSHDQPLVSYVDNFLIVLLGYGVIALIAVGYIGVISMLRRRYPRMDSPITRQIARMLRYVATFVKIVVLILFEFGIFPLGCGWWLDICTLELFGGTIQSRVSYCQESPWTCTAGHWILGIIYMVHISLFISLLREVVRPELLWFLRNPDDPEFHPFRELVEKPLSRHARRMCISVVIYVPLILALVYVPGQLCLKLLPTVFPFRSEDFSHILIDVPFGNLLIGPLIKLLYFGRPEISLRRLVGFWIRAISSVLGIHHLVVKDDELPHDREHMMHDHGIENENLGRDEGPLHRMFADQEDLAVADHASVADYAGSESGEELIHTAAEIQLRFVRLRACVMILSAWITLVSAESALLALPTILGRFMMSAVGLPVRHDLHPCLLGLNVLLGTISGICKIAKYLKTVDMLTMLSMGLPYLYLAGKGLIIVSIWLGAIPLAAGLLFELILVPIRVSFNETPYFCLHQDWALGLLLLKVWSCIAVTGGLGAKWRERVLRAKEGDIIDLDQNFSRTMREVVLPVLVSVITALSVPYSVARGLLPILGVARWISNLVYRYAYLVVTCLCCGFEAVRYSVSVLRDLHDSIRDDKYLVGKRLYNFIDNAASTANRSGRGTSVDQ